MSIISISSIQAGERLPCGTVVSYGDYANSRKKSVVVTTDWKHVGQRCVRLDGSGESQVSRHAISALGGWQLEKETLTPDEIMDVLEKRKMHVIAEQINRDESERIRKDRRAAAILWQRQHRPAWAKAVIIAEHVEDDSDGQIDYYGHKTKAVVFLAWSKHTRNLFPELRKAAAKLPETAHLSIPAETDEGGRKPGDEWYTRPRDEHVENYSMGGGTYLKNAISRHCSGWSVRKADLPDSLESAARLFEDIRQLK